MAPDLILTGVVQAAVASRDATKTIPIVCPPEGTDKLGDAINALYEVVKK